MEQIIRNSLLERMDNWKQKSDAGSKWWSNSKGGWRPKKEQIENNEKTSKKQAENKQKTSKKQASISISRSISNKIEDKVKVEDNKKNKYLDFVYLSEEEHQKLTTQLWVKLTNELIEKLNNYIWSIWKDKYKSHYFTILNWSKNENVSTTHTDYERERQAELHRQKIAEQIKSFTSESKQNAEATNESGWYNWRENISFS
jgi:hypothetical protein